jgi:hypothetical protein
MIATIHSYEMFCGNGIHFSIFISMDVFPLWAAMLI